MYFNAISVHLDTPVTMGTLELSLTTAKANQSDSHSPMVPVTIVFSNITKGTEAFASLSTANTAIAGTARVYASIRGPSSADYDVMFINDVHSYWVLAIGTLTYIL